MGTHNSSSAALSSLDPSTIKQPPGSRGDTHSSYALSTLKDTHTINHDDTRIGPGRDTGHATASSPSDATGEAGSKAKGNAPTASMGEAESNVPLIRPNGNLNSTPDQTIASWMTAPSHRNLRHPNWRRSPAQCTFTWSDVSGSEDSEDSSRNKNVGRQRYYINDRPAHRRRRGRYSRDRRPRTTIEQYENPINIGEYIIPSSAAPGTDIKTGTAAHGTSGTGTTQGAAGGMTKYTVFYASKVGDPSNRAAGKFGIAKTFVPFTDANANADASASASALDTQQQEEHYMIEDLGKTDNLEGFMYNHMGSEADVSVYGQAVDLAKEWVDRKKIQASSVTDSCATGQMWIS